MRLPRLTKNEDPDRKHATAWAYLVWLVLLPAAVIQSSIWWQIPAISPDDPALGVRLAYVKGGLFFAIGLLATIMDLTRGWRSRRGWVLKDES